MPLHSGKDPAATQRSKEETVVVISWGRLMALLVTALALISTVLFFLPVLSYRFGPSLSLSTEKAEYGKGDSVKIEGLARESLLTPLASEPVAIEVRSGESIVWIDQVITDKSGHFSTSFTLGENSPPGSYEAYASTRVSQGLTSFSVRA